MQVADPVQHMVLHALQQALRRHPAWPVVVAQTGLHRLYPAGIGHPTRYPYTGGPEDETHSALPHALRQALAHQRRLFDDLRGPRPRFVPIDFTVPEDGIPPHDFGLEMLWHVLQEAGPGAFEALQPQWRLDPLRNYSGPLDPLRSYSAIERATPVVSDSSVSGTADGLGDWVLRMPSQRHRAGSVPEPRGIGPVPADSWEISELMSKNRILESKIVDPSHLTDADWAEINKLKRAFEDGGKTALSKAVEKLGNDPIRYVNVMAAFFPEMIREKLKDSLADADADDVRELIQKLETPAIRPRICH
jgi:hypothetical protein